MPDREEKIPRLSVLPIPTPIPTENPAKAALQSQFEEHRLSENAQITQDKLRFPQRAWPQRLRWQNRRPRPMKHARSNECNPLFNRRSASSSLRENRGSGITQINKGIDRQRIPVPLHRQCRFVMIRF